MTSISIAAGERPRTTRMTLLAHAAPPAAYASRFAADAPADAGALHRLERWGRRRPAFEHVVRGPAVAAAETAAALGVAASIEPALGDRSLGTWSGRDIAAVAADDPDGLAAWLGDPEAAAPGGESVVALGARLVPWLAHMAEARLSVLAIMHPAVVRSCIVLALEAAPATWFRLDLGFGTRSLLTHAGAVWRVGGINAGDHDGP